MKRELRLGDRVLWNGRVAEVDALTQTCAGLVLTDGSYVMADYGELQRTE